MSKDQKTQPGSLDPVVSRRRRKSIILCLLATGMMVTVWFFGGWKVGLATIVMTMIYIAVNAFVGWVLDD